MIPKIIHYCWLSGDPYPESIQRCIDSWKRVLPDYEFVLWDTNRFALASSEWVRQAFEKRKYAFAADYIRMYALYHYGGIYLDSDVEVLKTFDDLLDLPYFLGQEKTPSGIEAATIGSEKNWSLAKLMLDRYDSRSFIGEDGHPDLRAMPYLMRWCIESNYRYNPIREKSQFDLSKSVINVFPADYFSPKDWNDGTIITTPDTYSIHHFAASWMSGTVKKRNKLIRLKEIISHYYKKFCSLSGTDIALLSNRPLAFHFYDYYSRPYYTPLKNTKVYGGEFVHLLNLLESGRPLNLSFIPYSQSRHTTAGQDFYPVGIVEDSDIEIHFIRTLTRDEAQKDWETGLERMKNKKRVVAFVVLTEEDERLFQTIKLPKFKISSSDKGLADLSPDNCDSYFWKRLPVMEGIRRKVKRALRNNG